MLGWMTPIAPQVAPARQSAHPRAQAERHRGRGCRLRRRRQPRLPASAGGGAKAPAQPGPRRAHRRTARGCRRRCPTSLWHATVAPRAAPHSSAGSPERHGRRVDPLISETDGQGSPEHAQGHKDEVSAHIPTDRSSGAWRSRVRCTRPDNTAPVVRMPSSTSAIGWVKPEVSAKIDTLTASRPRCPPTARPPAWPGCAAKPAPGCSATAYAPDRPSSTAVWSPPAKPCHLRPYASTPIHSPGCSRRLRPTPDRSRRRGPALTAFGAEPLIRRHLSLGRGSGT